MNKGITPPGRNSGIGRMQNFGVKEKPKDMGGTLRRLWNLTAGHRQGLGWILLLSALASASSILSPLLIGSAVNLIDGGDRALWLLALLFGLYVSDWLARFCSSSSWPPPGRESSSISDESVLRHGEAARWHFLTGGSTGS